MKAQKYSGKEGRGDVRFAIASSIVGFILVASSERGICAIMLGDDPDSMSRDLRDDFSQANLIGADDKSRAFLEKVDTDFSENATKLESRAVERDNQNENRSRQFVTQIVRFVQSPQIDFNLPLDIRGTMFQKRVWQALCQIPPGQTISYSALAHRIGQPKAVRAVAHACAANKIAVAIPCHRVIRNDGTLSGYRWGVERKRILLEKEAQLLKKQGLPGNG